MTDQVKHLLGGYATGTLTEAENAALMRAALEDQELFNTLADDEALRRYLADVDFRQELLNAMAPKPHRLRWIAAFGAAAACLIAALLWTTHRGGAPTNQLALSRPQAIAPSHTPVPDVESVKKPPAAPVKPLIRKKSAQSVATLDQVESAPPVLPAPNAFAPRAAVMAKAAMPRPAVTAHITDVNAAIVTIDMGSNADVRIGDRLDVSHDDSRIGFLIVTSAEAGFAVGKYSGATPPSVGDTAETPKK